MKREHLELFEELADSPTVPLKGVKHLLVIAGTPRCGSTLFCERLTSLRSVGRCEEWLNNEYFPVWEKVTGKQFNLGTYLNWVIERAATDVFSIKALVGQMHHAVTKYQFAFSGNMKLWYLYRNDKVAQAVSLAKAVASDKYRSYETGIDNPLIHNTDVAYNLYILSTQDRWYDENFRSKEAGRFEYSEFIQPGVAYETVLKSVGKELDGEMEARVKKQANKHSERCIKDFRRWLG